MHMNVPHLRVAHLGGVLTAITLTGLVPAQITAVPFRSLPKATDSSLSRSAWVGHKKSTDILHISVSLPFADEKGMEKFVESVSNPTSPDYRRFITPEQVGVRFGLPIARVNEVRSYLEQNGMTVKLVGKNRLSILADATVAQAETAFKTSIQTFSVPNLATNREEIRYSFVKSPSVPQVLAKYILDIGGLENVRRPRHRELTPTQMRQLYGTASAFASQFRGQGRTVGISSWDGFDLNNVKLEYAHFNLPAPVGGVGSNIKVRVTDGGSQSSSPFGEADLDIQNVLSAAPLCNLIIYDGGLSVSDPIDVLTQEVNDNVADIITESYGWGNDTPTSAACHRLHLSMTAQGITYMCASGDYGTDVEGQYYPDDDPEVLMVGGTDIVVKADGSRQSEIGWDGSGGGWCTDSDLFNVLPSYQKNLNLSSKPNFRLIPDIALNAGPTSTYPIFVSGSIQGIYGTSGASPFFAGSLAIVEQQLIAAGKLTGIKRLGRIQDTLYAYNGDPTVFYDVTSGNNGNLPNGKPGNATAGWDYVTGWGAVKFDGLFNKLSGTAGAVSLTLSTTTIQGGIGTVTGTITLGAKAPAAGTTVGLSSSDPTAQVPTKVIVASGSTTANFQINTSAVTASKTVVITASVANALSSASLTLTPIQISSVSPSTLTIVGGSTPNSVAKVTLTGPAPTNGLTVALASSNPKVVGVPTNVTIPSGATSTTFAISTFGVTSNQSATVTVSLAGKATTLTVTVTPATLASVALSSSTTYGGGATLTGTVTLNGVASTGGVTVNLASSNPKLATLSATKVVVPAGKSSTTFTISTVPVDASSVVKVTASQASQSASTSLTINPPTLTSIGLGATSIPGVSTTSLTVTLNGPAGPSGASVSLSTNTPSIVGLNPTNLVVKSGATTGTVKVTVAKVSTATKATITVQLGTASKTITLTITP